MQAQMLLPDPQSLTTSMSSVSWLLRPLLEQQHLHSFPSELTKATMADYHCAGYLTRDIRTETGKQRAHSTAVFLCDLRPHPCSECTPL